MLLINNVWNDTYRNVISLIILNKKTFHFMDHSGLYLLECFDVLSILYYTYEI